MNLLFANNIKIANKWLVLLAGLDKNAVNKQGKKIYEYQYFNLPNQWRETKLSKLNMIKQVLAYAGLSNSEGDLGIVDLEELAGLLHCSIRTLVNNNKTLEKLDLVEVDKLYGDLVHIKLKNYQYNFLDLYRKNNYDSEDEYKAYTGYARINRSALFDMFKIEEVNLLRIACRALYLQEKEVHLGGNKSILMSSEMLKGFLPTYFSYRPVLERALRKVRHLFDVEFFSLKNDKDFLLKSIKATPTIYEKFKAPYLLSMKLHPSKDSRKLMEDDEHAYSLIAMSMREFYETTGASRIDLGSIKDLVLEYGGNTVSKALEDIVACYKHEYQTISEAAMEVFNEIKSLRMVAEPIGILRKIFKKYSISTQEGYLFQP